MLSTLLHLVGQLHKGHMACAHRLEHVVHVVAEVKVKFDTVRELDVRLRRLHYKVHRHEALVGHRYILIRASVAIRHIDGGNGVERELSLL